MALNTNKFDRKEILTPSSIDIELDSSKRPFFKTDVQNGDFDLQNKDSDSYGDEFFKEDELIIED